MVANVAFVRPERSERSEAIAYGEQFDLAANQEVTRDAVAPNQRYRIELELDEAGTGRSRTTRHFHYRPYQQTGERLVQIRLFEDGVGFSP